MFVGHGGGDAATRGALDESSLDEVGFDNIFDGVFFFADGCGQAFDSDWSTCILLDHC